ncbi:hypothetical protein ACIO02_34180 [Streptomyces sp. NPDC087568]
MTAVEWLLWASAIWTVFLAYCVADVPSLLAQLAQWKRGHR